MAGFSSQLAVLCRSTSNIASLDVTHLDEKASLATVIEPISRVTDGGPIIDFWPYFESIPASDFDGHDGIEWQVDWVYCMGDCCKHVMVNSTNKNVFMAIILDVAGGRVLGHRLMNFNSLYGLETPTTDCRPHQ